MTEFEKKLWKEINSLKEKVDYNNRLLEELTLLFDNSKKPKEAMSAQMNMLKQMFANLPIDPELKKGLNEIFDQAGGR